jgi:sigma-B regulation protein RsbU (phosphoserine phosphatase)
VSPHHPTESWDDAPCGLLRASADRRIRAVNRTLAGWLGYQPEQLIGRRFTELFTVGGRLHFETNVAPRLHLDGGITGLAVDLVTADGTRRPVLVTADYLRADDGSGVTRMAVLDARDRRSYEQELLAERRRAEAERNRAEELAATLRSSLLPPSLTPPPGMAAAAHFHPATDDVTGDFYDLYPQTASRWGFFLGDVVGKGAAAAALTSLTRYTLRAAAVADADPQAMLRTLNSVFMQRREGRFPAFATVVVGTVTVLADGAEVELASGGHPLPLLFSASGAVDTVDTLGGQAIGLIAEPRLRSARIRLGPGDTMLLYSDGLTEARSGPAPHRFDDDEGLLQFARRHAPTTPYDLIDALRGLLDDLGAGIQDDVALLAIGVTREGADP